MRPVVRGVVKVMSDCPPFLFVTCQVGAEHAVKSEVRRHWPAFRFAYSRPGFLTFKLPSRHALAADFDLESVFARSYAFSLGKVAGEDLDALARGAWEVLGTRPVKRVHVWERDAAPPGEHGFEPSITPAAVSAADALARQCPWPERPGAKVFDLRQPARAGDLVLDCVIVRPGEWWVGFHAARSVPSQWPGGLMPLELPPHAVSRAWLKMEEALRWSQLPIPPGARCAEIGSAPGGSSQALLDRGFSVLGIDPAEMHPAVASHPRFRHVRRRVVQVARREFRKVRWLMADMNVAPRYTLDAVEAIVTHREVSVRGMLLTLKLTQWEFAEELPAYRARVRGWGYDVVRLRQLQHNRQEVCLAALQKPFRRKPFVRHD
jgi:23S rRNA (cytidine2498-2'-O)-methyltransferase